MQRLFCIRLHTLYKLGTPQRRIERRMAMASIESGGMDRYLDVLRSDPIELGHLAEDLLINVTRFFRDAKVFDYLAAKIVPDLVRNHSFDADCSDGCEH